MRKILRSFINWFLVTILVMGTISLVHAQGSLSPQPNPTPTEASVIFNGQTLWTISNRLGSRTPQQRSQKTNVAIAEFAKDYTLPLEDLRVISVDEEGIPLTEIVAGSNILVYISEQEAQALGKPRSELANEYLQKIRSVVEQYRQERSPGYLLRGDLYTIPATLLTLVALFLMNRLFAKIYRSLYAWTADHIHAIRLGNYEVLRPQQLNGFLILVTRLIQFTTILSILGVYFIFIFKQFPWTRGYARILWKNILKTLETSLQLFILYLPSLLIISLVVIAVYYIQKTTRSFFKELAEETISLPGFYPEWAWPSYRLSTFLMIMLAAVIVFPLLPGFQSPAFQGVSVFVGLLIS